MKSPFKLFVLACALILVTLSYGFSLSTDLDLYTKEVLVIQSYQRDYAHTVQMESGIESYFESSDEKVRLRYEYLDTKNSNNPLHLEALADIMADKYRTLDLDGVILGDDDALRFYLTYKDRLFNEAPPVVATGITTLAPYEPIDENMVLIEEKPDIKKTVQTALRQNAGHGIQTLNFIYDQSTTGALMRERVEALTLKNFTGYNVNHYDDLTPEELKTRIDNAALTELFFFVVYTSDRNGKAYKYDEVPLYITKRAPTPIYTFWEFYIGTGVIGGHVASSALYGELAAEVLVKQWQSIPVPALLYETGERQRYVFDASVISRYNIRHIPDGAVVLNAPQSYFQKNKVLIIAFVLVVGAMATVIGLLTYGLRQKQAVYDKTKEIARLNFDIIETQKDIIARLGDVIETRSHETASHVSRVAEVSCLLARAYGLTDADAKMLQTISPMHDVGKIGIAETILHKPGKLSEEEFEIMKYHTQIGYEILKSGDKEMLHYASLVALEHHERWDGSGYPEGKKGNNIHIFARITNIADVYDALRSNRVYKASWPVSKAVDYLKEERGKFFEPKLVDLFLENLDAIEKIRENNHYDDSKKIHTFLKNIASKRT